MLTYNKLMHVCISHLPLLSNNSWYRYSVSVSEQAKSIGIGSIGKLWYWPHHIKHY